MEPESHGLFKEIHRIIEDGTNSIMDTISGTNSLQESILGELSEEEAGILQSISLNESQNNVLRQAFREFGRSIVFEMLCIIDAVHYTKEPIPDLAIITRTTRKEINQDFLHDEFYEALDD